ncbi:LPS-assembly protein LptD [Thalassovita sp.]|uniref:LPS-assembly protein LptD n=1 Tax=Thalassovita sp. TaxID=1979401 RepID=UPI0029DE7331|nr:LPS assembly protein LptD [Thalassovita sp.]
MTHRFAPIVLAAALMLGTASLTAHAQGADRAAPPAVLIADSLKVDGRNRLIANGHVEVMYDDIRMRAERIEYDRKADKLRITGPISITQGDETIILANSGELDSKLENGILRGARMVMNRQVQLAAAQIDRVGGRYTQLYKVAATSCRVCDSDTPPIWQIRAKRTIHDQQERQLYFENAQLRVLDVPVLWLPWMRMPDPTLERATGFLIPELNQSSELGLGLKLPYFIRMGDHRDLTLTPFVSTQTTTLEWRYRQAFRTGRVTFHGALSDDTLQPGDLRGFVFGEGLFNLRNDYKLSFGIEAVTDRAYLLDYDYSDKDRLQSELAITRTTRDDYRRAALVNFQTLRDDEDNATIPTIVGDAEYERRFFPSRMGGELRMSFATHSHYRTSDVSTDGPDSDIWGDGRDVSRAEAALQWSRGWTIGPGIQAEFLAGAAVDAYTIRQDDTAALDNEVTVTPQTSLTLRWPWLKATPVGTVHTIEPVLMLGWVGGDGLNIPNDESTLVEFDEGNLLSLSHYPAADRRDRGAMAALGINWTRVAQSGWTSALTLGQIIREDADTRFSATSGLSGLSSDLLVAGQIRNADGLGLTARALFGNGLDVSKAEARASWQSARTGLSLSYVWLGADPDEDRDDTVSEWTLDGSRRFSRHWTGTANWRYDVADRQATGAALGLRYTNECVEVDLSVSRRFTSSSTVDPSTNFGFTVGLKGFSSGSSDQSYARTCRN